MGKLKEDDKYKYAAEAILANDVVQGRAGKDSDRAHAPIYPLELKTSFSGGVYEESVYEFIVNNFLASVSEDAKL